MNKATAVDRDALLHTRRASGRRMAGDTELGSWAECVTTLLGPRMAGEGVERHRLNALRLAAAALDAAGSDELAALARASLEPSPH